MLDASFSFDGVIGAFALSNNMVIIALGHVRWWWKLSYAIYGVGLVMLVTVEIIGDIGGGAQRWLKSSASAEAIRTAVAAVGGHASCYTADHCDSPFQPLAAPLLHYHRQLKAQLDPQGIFNPGRMYAEV